MVSQTVFGENVMKYLAIDDDELFHLLEDVIVHYQRMTIAAKEHPVVSLSSVLHGISYLGGVINGDYMQPCLTETQRRTAVMNGAANFLALIPLRRLSQET